MLEQGVGRVKDLNAHFLNSTDENDRLAEIAINPDGVKNAGDQQVVKAHNELSKLSRNWSGQWAIAWKWSRPSATEWTRARPWASEWRAQDRAQEELTRRAGK